MRRKKHGDHANHERWLVSYADFITLLFAFFVMMYALSMQNLAKVKAAAESIRKAFGGPAAVSGVGPGTGLRDNTQFNPFDPTVGSPAFQQLKGEFEEAAKVETGSSELGEKMETFTDKRGLVVRLTAPDFFAPGEAVVRSDLRPLLDRIGRVVVRSGKSVRIEGFSDPSEEHHSGSFASDWELSAARAAWVAKYWMSRFELTPEKIGVAGYAHFHPLNETDGVMRGGGKSRDSWARAQNRRIEVVVLP